MGTEPKCSAKHWVVARSDASNGIRQFPERMPQYQYKVVQYDFEPTYRSGIIAVLPLTNIAVIAGAEGSASKLQNIQERLNGRIPASMEAS